MPQSVTPPRSQPALAGMYPSGIEPGARRIWKRQRTTAREVYRRQRDEDQARRAAGKETGAGRALRLLAAYWNRHQQSPTAYELLMFGRRLGENLRDVNAIRPNITRLYKQGLIEPRAPRACTVTGQRVRTWAVREAGSAEPR